MAQKKNIRKVPPRVKKQLDDLHDRNIVAGCARTFNAVELNGGILEHLHVELTPDGLSVPESVLPRPERGKYSKRNVEGYDKRRDDLGLQTGSHSVEAPDYGDWSLGSHTVQLTHRYYLREHVPPRGSTIDMECADDSPGREKYVVVFKVSEILDREAADFDQRLLACLNPDFLV